MNCPVDGGLLQMTERQGIEIDYCPTCRGVWLDRGELDKLIERSAIVSRGDELEVAAGRERARDTRPRDDHYREDDRSRYDRDDDDYDRSRGGKPYRKKRGSFLSDLFDID
jgi:Zn-finger nucleic acid-binding protein